MKMNLRTEGLNQNETEILLGFAAIVEMMADKVENATRLGMDQDEALRIVKANVIAHLQSK